MAPLPEQIAWVAQQTAWAAGLFEGEGSFSASGSRGQVLYMELSMTDQDVVLRFEQIVGHGHVTKRKRQPDRPAHYKDQWRWSCGDRDEVRAVVEEFWPWLGQRRRERFIELWSQTATERRPYDAGSYKRALCQRGHDDWKDRTDGRRECRTCQREARRLWKIKRRRDRAPLIEEVMPDESFA